ncbi:MAG: PilZ domain-containing protein [Acidobacteriota bacterium]
MATHCPKCINPFTRRVRRKGGWEFLLSYLYLYPHRCQICSHQFRAFKPFKRYLRRSIDRRQYERIETDLPAHFSCPEQQGEGRVIDLSIAGCRLKSDAHLKEETILTLQIQIPGEEVTISVEGALVTISKPEFMGLQFLKFSDNHQSKLSKLMLTKLAVVNISNI